MNFDLLFEALSHPLRRRLLDELAERDGQTLFELHVRLEGWYAKPVSRQALSKHLSNLEEAGLVRAEWQWRSKHHYLQRAPLREMSVIWMGPLAGLHFPQTSEVTHEDRTDERAGRRSGSSA